MVIGNTVLYGATRGRAFFRGLAGERFGVRNSGVHAVIEGVGDHGCEYMTGGRVVVLGPTGRNFAAGMSGGVAYVLDEEDVFAERCNQQIVDLEEPSADDLEELRALVEEHGERTESPVAARVLRDWDDLSGAWVKVMPRDYKRALAEMAEQEAAGGGGRVARRASQRKRGGDRGHARRRPRGGIGVGRGRRHRRGRRVRAVGELGGFLKIHRENGPKRPVGERLHDFREYQASLPVPKLQEQGARCMECGIPFCHSGCPLGNLIPDWNDLVYRDRWREAIDPLHATNNFPEFTGRICPAPCEAACVLDINDDAVTIKQIEQSRSSTGPSRRAGSSPSRRRCAAATAGRGDRLRPGRAGRGRASSTSSGTRSPCTSATTVSAACCATACPTSSSTRTWSSGAWTSWRRRASRFGPAWTSAATSPATSCASASTPW